MLDSVPQVVLIALAILAGFAGLIWSADRFVAGSAAIAKSFGVAPLVIGLTIVSFGTSAPEIMVSISASLKGAGDLAVGNALGSNIANMGLVLAATALVATIPVQRHLLKDELPILFLVCLVAGFFLYDSVLSRWESAALLIGLVPAIYYLVRMKQGELSATEIAEEEAIPEMSRTRAFGWFLIGLAALMLSSEVLVWGAKTAAALAGVSPLVIGLTVIALGTSLPELAASMVSALKGHHDIALGNILGSNMFNLMAVMSIPGLAKPLTMDDDVFARDYGAMMALTVLLALLIGISFWMSKKASGEGALGKTAGIFLLCGYIAYYLVLYKTAA
ncbi:cation:H+ antiporter [Alteromonadaceae bacterium 2753L.S.0a.02]|nr:cation:H+ antiporter [Alteromonadaceae bacterium 2753L.S.0a.02]